MTKPGAHLEEKTAMVIESGMTKISATLSTIMTIIHG